MANKGVSFYEVLGVDKAADDRTIKKAYFALVRKYPPETHPEEFKKIREAYEVLSNAQSRTDYDSINQYDQYGEEVSARVKAGMDAMDAGDYRTAQREFIEVLRLQPQLYFARDMLGMAYLNNDQPAEALAQFDALVSAQPDNAVYHLHRGYAYYHQKQYQQAMDAYRAAKQRDEADTRVLVAMADCLSSMKQYEAALEELQKAIDMDGQVDFQDFVFFMRKVQIQLLRNRADLAEQDLDQIFKILPDDAETKKYVATRLASLAADLFAMKRSVDANRLLNRCKQLDPSRASMGFQFPARSTLPIAQLPENSKTWIATHGKEWAAGKLQHGVWGGPIFLLIIAVIFQLAMLNAGLNSTRLWAGSTAAWMVFFIIGAPLFLGLAISRVRRVSKSPYGKYTTIHPLHLLQVDVDKVTVWPLVNLHDVSLTHHSTNGVYQYTAVRLDFAGTICNLTIRGQQASVDWANQLLGQRRRVLELMSMGLLDAEEGFDMVPPNLMGGAPKKEVTPADAAAKQARLKWYGAFAGAGVLLAGIAIPLNRGAAEREAWRMCSRYPSMSEYRSYLDRFPSGKHAKDAKDAIGAKYDEAIAAYKVKQKDADPKGLQAIIDVVNALKESGSRKIKITYASEIDFSSVKNYDTADTAGIISADPAFTASYNKTREGSITTSLRKAFQDMFSHDVIDFDDGGYHYDSYSYRSYGTKETTSPVTFVVKYKVGPSGSIYESTTGKKKKLYGILFDWNFSIKFDGEAADRYAMQLSSAPAKNIKYTTYGDYEANSDIVPYTKMAESGFEEFGRKLAAGFGVTITAAASGSGSYSGSYGGYGGYGGYGSYGSKYGSGSYGSKYGSGSYGSGTGLSPELQKALDDLKRNGKFSAETQKLLDDLKKNKYK